MARRKAAAAGVGAHALVALACWTLGAASQLSSTAATASDHYSQRYQRPIMVPAAGAGAGSLSPEANYLPHSPSPAVLALPESAQAAPAGAPNSSPPHARLASGARKMQTVAYAPHLHSLGRAAGPPGQQASPAALQCLADSSFFHQPSQCLSQRPFATVGLPAFRNEDFLEDQQPAAKRSGDEQRPQASFAPRKGCVFVLSNGLFKNFNTLRGSFKGDGKCLDSSRASLAFSFANVTLTYLWELRCVNKLPPPPPARESVAAKPAAEQLAGQTKPAREADNLVGQFRASGKPSAGSCAHVTSQSFGFTSLQLGNLEAEFDFVTDVYKNWRITNASVEMVSWPTAKFRQLVASQPPAAGLETPPTQAKPPVIATQLNEFQFELLDGDELNARLHEVYENWARNKLHANFVEQFRRFLWASLQRCLVSSNEKSLANKLPDIFENAAGAPSATIH